MKPSSQSQAHIYWISLLAFPLFFLVNYLFNHQREFLNWLPQGRPTYFFAVLLPFGTLIPSFALGWLIRSQNGKPNAFGATLTRRDFLMALIAFAVGLVAIYFAVGRKMHLDAANLGNAIHYFIWLLMASIPEVLVFIGIVLHATEAGIKHLWHGRGGQITSTISGIIVSAVAFGLFHFSYPSPWNTWEKVMTLVPVWLAVATLYVLTRSLIAAVIYNNMMAIIGFLLYNLSLPGSELLGLVSDGISIVAVLAILAFMLSPGKQVLQNRTAG